MNGTKRLFGFNGRYQAFNNAIYKAQCAIGAVYGKYFTLYASLVFSMSMGAFLGFTGDDCYGKIPFNSPVFWIALVVALFFFFQTFILIELTFGKIVRLITVAICGHYLAYQLYGFWSLANVDIMIGNLSSVPASRIENVVMNTGVIDTVNGVGVCKPFAYANIMYGHIWLTVPAIALIMICFFVGNNKNT